MYATYRRCFLDSKVLRYSYTSLTRILAFYVLYNAVVSKDHLLKEELMSDNVLFARLEETPGREPQCAHMNSSGLCAEWSWLEACESSSERLFLTTYVQETLFVGGPRIQTISSFQDSSLAGRSHWVQNASQSFYIGEPEAWNLVIEHRLATSFGVWPGQELIGFLRSKQLASSKTPGAHVFKGLPLSPRDTFGKVPKGDRRVHLPIRDLLASVDLDLDQECDRCAEFNLTGEAARLRRVGLELDVTLFYSNLWFSWDRPRTWLLPSKDVSFEILVAARQPLEGVRTIRTAGQSELFERIPPGTRSRVTRRSFGVRMFFHQRGIIGALDLSAMVAFLVKSLTFLTIAWSVSEILVDFTPLICSFLGKEHPPWYGFCVSETSEDKFQEQKEKSL